MYNEMTQAYEQKDWDTLERRYAQCVNDAKLYQGLSRLYNINPEVYNDMSSLGNEIENNGAMDTQNITENSDLEARLERLENTLTQLIEMQQEIDPQEQERQDEEKDGKKELYIKKMVLK